MKRTALALCLSLFLALGLTACIESDIPLIGPETAQTIPGVEGNWTSQQGDSTVRVLIEARGEDNGYLLRNPEAPESESFLLYFRPLTPEAHLGLMRTIAEEGSDAREEPDIYFILLYGENESTVALYEGPKNQEAIAALLQDNGYGDKDLGYLDYSLALLLPGEDARLDLLRLLAGNTDVLARQTYRRDR